MYGLGLILYIYELTQTGPSNWTILLLSIWKYRHYINNYTPLKFFLAQPLCYILAYITKHNTTLFYATITSILFQLFHHTPYHSLIMLIISLLLSTPSPQLLTLAFYIRDYLGITYYIPITLLYKSIV
jgi:hypothetical protein